MANINRLWWLTGPRAWTRKKEIWLCGFIEIEKAGIKNVMESEVGRTNHMGKACRKWSSSFRESYSATLSTSKLKTRFGQHPVREQEEERVMGSVEGLFHLRLPSIHQSNRRLPYSFFRRRNHGNACKNLKFHEMLLQKHDTDDTDRNWDVEVEIDDIDTQTFRYRWRGQDKCLDKLN